jgi:hypothetical protein
MIRFLIPAFCVNREKNLSRHAQGLPSFFPGRVGFAPVYALKTVRVGKNKLGQFKAQAFMLALVGLAFVIVPFNVCPAHK